MSCCHHGEDSHIDPRQEGGLVFPRLLVSLAALVLLSASAAPTVWTPPATGSPLRRIWSFDTKG